MILVLSRSHSFERHVAGALAGVDQVDFLPRPDALPDAFDSAPRALLVHGPSFPGSLDELFDAVAGRSDLMVGMAADAPWLQEMLAVGARGVRAYFNSYMADVHYRQMLEMLTAGQGWYPPQLLALALEAARRALPAGLASEALDELTPREREIALDVAIGLTNQQIAETRAISERTVKTHLTRVYKKLGVPNRVTLAVRLQG